MSQYQRGKEAELALEVGVPKHDYFGKLGTTHFAANFKLYLFVKFIGNLYFKEKSFTFNQVRQLLDINHTRGGFCRDNNNSITSTKVMSVGL